MLTWLSRSAGVFALRRTRVHRTEDGGCGGSADALRSTLTQTWIMPNDGAVTVRDLHKAYREVTALSGVDLDIGRGEVFALLGPNGAGKTTAVEILEGFRRRDSGTVAVLGHDPAHPSREWRARIGIVLQLAGTGPELTVLEMVRHFAAFYPRPREPEEAVELVGLTAKSRSRIGTLSGGQARRLDVALGIVGRPELLFLDEPTTGFDPEARRQFWQLIRRLREDGTTIVLTTHYLDEAEALADRIAVIAAGRIVASGDPGSLGGRAAAAARVSWDTLDMAGAEGVPHPGRAMVETTTPTRLVAELAREFSGEVPGLTVTRPTLEDIYLDLIAKASHDRKPS
jgi:ABC-2 type transport system ATP-binding protein